MKRVSVVGLGPGHMQGMTGEALEAIREATVVAGYDLYVSLVAPLTGGKKIISTAMKKETQRCRMALTEAAGGNAVAMVCSGDSGVYGMAGILLELAPEFPGVEIRVIPGVTAACSGGAVLGAPLGHDFAVISLSDLLTPWEKIGMRLEMAARGDLAICLYNPSSHKRKDYLERACRILLKHRDPGTVCGYVRNIGREGQSMDLCTLEELAIRQVDMFTTVFIGNSQTREVGGRMVTPRGYDGV